MSAQKLKLSDGYFIGDVVGTDDRGFPKVKVADVGGSNPEIGSIVAVRDAKVLYHCNEIIGTYEDVTDAE